MLTRTINQIISKNYLCKIQEAWFSTVLSPCVIIYIWAIIMIWHTLHMCKWPHTRHCKAVVIRSTSNDLMGRRVGAQQGHVGMARKKKQWSKLLMSKLIKTRYQSVQTKLNLLPWFRRFGKLDFSHYYSFFPCLHFLVWDQKCQNPSRKAVLLLFLVQFCRSKETG